MHVELTGWVAAPAADPPTRSRATTLKVDTRLSPEYFRLRSAYIYPSELEDCLFGGELCRTLGEMEHLHPNASRSVTAAVQSSARTMWFTGVAIASVYGVISVSGLIGNITLIKTFCSAKSIRNVPNLFMSSLALGDVLLLVTCAPVDASRYLSEEWLFGRVGCKVIPFIQLTSVGVSVFTLTALSADR